MWKEAEGCPAVIVLIGGVAVVVWCGDVGSLSLWYGELAMARAPKVSAVNLDSAARSSEWTCRRFLSFLLQSRRFRTKKAWYRIRPSPPRGNPTVEGGVLKVAHLPVPPGPRPPPAACPCSL